VPRLERGVGRKHGLECRLAKGLLEPQAILLDPFAGTLEDGERTVPLVEVQQLGTHPERPERPEAADPEQHLLPDARHLVAAVEPGCQPAEVRAVGFHLGVEQQQQGPAHTGNPDARVERRASARHLDRDRSIVRPDRPPQRQVLHVGQPVLFLLPAAFVEPLPEVAAGVEQPDADDRQPEVRSALEVVPGEHSEPPGIKGERFVQTELGREVRDWRRPQRAGRRAPRAVGDECS
jgi:hypothetical protein